MPSRNTRLICFPVAAVAGSWLKVVGVFQGAKAGKLSPFQESDETNPWAVGLCSPWNSGAEEKLGLDGSRHYW